MKDLTVTLGQSCEGLRKEKTMDNYHRRLMCIHTHFQIVNGPGSGVQIDETSSLTNFYTCFLDLLKNQKIIQGTRKQEIQKLLLSLLSNFFIEKRQYSVEIIASFLSVLARIVSKYGIKKKFYKTLLFTMKKILKKYGKLNKMLDDENEGFGLDAFMPEQENPQVSNAINSCILPDLKPLLKDLDPNTTEGYILEKILTAQPLKIQLKGRGILEFYHG